MPVDLPAGARVCLVMMSAIGDTVHALPVVTALKRHDPSLRLTWVLQPGPAALVSGHPDVDEIIVFERSRGLGAYPDVRRKLAGRSFDVVIDLQVYFKASVVTALADAPLKLGFDRARARDLNWLVTNRKIPPHPPQHVQDQYFEFLHFLGISPEPVEWNLGPWPDELAGQQELLSRIDRPIVSLAVGTSDPRREWLPERWAELCDYIYDAQGLQPVLVGGKSPRELESERRIREVAKRPLVSTLGASLREMVGILDGSALVISLNTAPLHMAVALDRPVIGLMGHRNPKRTGPYRFQDLMVDAYGRAGEDYGVSMEKRSEGLERITVDDVQGKIVRWRELYG